MVLYTINTAVKYICQTDNKNKQRKHSSCIKNDTCDKCQLKNYKGFVASLNLQEDYKRYVKNMETLETEMNLQEETEL